MIGGGGYRISDHCAGGCNGKDQLILQFVEIVMANQNHVNIEKTQF